ncbi:O-antigen ligase family protein [Alteromonas sp. A081]|uniref:O-antigen ligase family protein n=1 Tax=Alteromonas sp. A081 TaxID=3410269 RepID=UPI003B97EB7A
MSFFLIGGVLFLINTNAISSLVARYRVYIVLWFAFLAWQLLTIIPLPPEVVNAIRPTRTEPLFAIFSNDLTPLPWLSLSFDVGQSVISFFKSLAYCFLFFICLTMISTGNRLRQVLITLSIAGIFQAIYGTLEVLLNTDYSAVFNYPVTHIATGSFVYKNHYANYLLLSLSAAIGYLIANLYTTPESSKRERLRRIVKFWLSNKVLFRIGIIIMVIALVMSRSRMGNTAFFIAMTVTATLGLLYFKPKHKSYVTLFISMLVIDVLIVSSLFGLKQVQQRLEQTTLAEESRDEVIVEALPLVAQYPIIGTGGGTFYTVYPQQQSKSVQHFYDHAHNEYLQFSIEFGLVGAILAAAIVIFSARHSFSAMRTRRHPLPRGTAFAALMACIGMAMHSSVDFPLQAPANTSTFIVLLTLGILSNSLSMHKEKH